MELEPDASKNPLRDFIFAAILIDPIWFQSNSFLFC